MNNQELFQEYCETGRLADAKHLFQSDNTIDISADHEYAFSLACENGYLDVAKWLYSVKPSINISESTFRYACYNNNLEVARWLLSLCPNKYEIIIENNNIIDYNVKV